MMGFIPQAGKGIGGLGKWTQILHVPLYNLVIGHITSYISSQAFYTAWLCNMLYNTCIMLYSTFIIQQIKYFYTTCYIWYAPCIIWVYNMFISYITNLVTCYATHYIPNILCYIAKVVYNIKCMFESGTALASQATPQGSNQHAKTTGCKAGLAEKQRCQRRGAPTGPKTPDESRGARPLLNSRGVKFWDWAVVEWTVLNFVANFWAPVRFLHQTF